jgi:hypothetical protein
MSSFQKNRPYMRGTRMNPELAVLPTIEKLSETAVKMAAIKTKANLDADVALVVCFRSYPETLLSMFTNLKHFLKQSFQLFVIDDCSNENDQHNLLTLCGVHNLVYIKKDPTYPSPLLYGFRHIDAKKYNYVGTIASDLFLLGPIDLDEINVLAAQTTDELIHSDFAIWRSSVGFDKRRWPLHPVEDTEWIQRIEKSSDFNTFLPRQLQNYYAYFKEQNPVVGLLNYNPVYIKYHNEEKNIVLHRQGMVIFLRAIDSCVKA